MKKFLQKAINYIIGEMLFLFLIYSFFMNIRPLQKGGYIMDWKFEKIGLNICCFYTEKRKDIVKLEYDFDLKGYIIYSDYAITKHFTTNGRCYDRTKPGNISRYYRICSDLPYIESYKLFE